MNISTSEMIYASMLILSNQIKAQMDKVLLPYDITSQQWMLSLIVLYGEESQRTIKQIAKQMGSSHQNVKQIALKLEKRGHIVLEKNPNDLRETLVSPTKELLPFWREVEPIGIAFMRQLFDDLKEEDLEVTNNTIQKMMENLQVIEKLVEEGNL